MDLANKLLSDLEALKIKLANSGSPSHNNDVWSLQQFLQNICGKLLVEHQELALENGVERDLWNCGFRATITQLQSETKENKKGGASTESKDLLNWYLNSASGFYLQLLNQISSSNSLDFVFRRKDSVYGLVGGGLSTLPGVKAKDNKDTATKNAHYLCQYCLIHLGDLSRYRHQAKQAETFYRHAVTVAPTSGQPYNQLALLEAGRGNKLASVFLYIRALCVTAPFPGAPSNLVQTLAKVSNSKLKEESDCDFKVGSLTRMTKEEYIHLFLHFHSSLLLKGDVEGSKDDLCGLFSALSMLVATTTLTRSSLVQMVAINLFALNFFSCKLTVRQDENNSRRDEDKFVEPKECEGAVDLLEDLMVSMLAALLLPIHTMKEPEVVITYPALPAIRLMFEWILMEDKVSSRSLKKKQQIWPGLCSLVNFLQAPLAKFKSQEHEDTPLPEDWDLQGFQPVAKILSRYKFKESSSRLTPDKASLLRAKRLTDLTFRFSAEKSDGSAPIKKIVTKDKEGAKFEASSEHSPPVEEVLNLERLTLNPLPHVPSTKKKDKVGILKPQGSLERAKEGRGNGKEATPTSSSAEPASKPANQEKKIKISGSDKRIPISGTKTSILVSEASSKSEALIGSSRNRGRTNVALQAILKRTTNPLENKQVKFQTPSPAVSPKVTEGMVAEASATPPSLPPSSQLNVPRGKSFPPFADFQNRLPTRNMDPIQMQFNANNQFNINAAASSGANQFAPPINQFPNPSYISPLSTPQLRPSEDIFGGTFNPLPTGGVINAPLKNPEVSSFSQHLVRRTSPPFSTPGLFPTNTYGAVPEVLPFPKQWDTKPNLVVGGPSGDQTPRMASNFPPKDMNPTLSSLGGSFPNASFGGAPFQPSLPQQNQRAVGPPPQIFGSVPTFSPQTTPNLIPIYSQPILSGPQPTKDPVGRPMGPVGPQVTSNKCSIVGAPGIPIGSSASTMYVSPGGSNSTSFWGDKDPMAAIYLSQLMTRPPPPMRSVADASIDTSVPPPLNKEMLPHPQGIPSVTQGFTQEISPHDQLKNFGIRNSNTYSLFGPLGDSSNVHSVSSHQLISSQPQHTSHQSLWSGPSPLQRLLEQKKFSTQK